MTTLPSTVEESRTAFRAWLVEHHLELEQFRHTGGDITDVFDQLRLLQRMLFDAGWIRLGWPESLGGLGGRPILRSIVSEELAMAGYPPPFSFATQEVLGPAVAEFARPDLGAVVLPRLLRGDETWCQGFSEPGAGSDLASLRLKAVAVDGGWRVSGEKIWTSWAQFADRCVLLARTGSPDSAHRGISAFLLDMDTPGIKTSPLRSMNGDDEFCSLFFDDVLVGDGVIGEAFELLMGLRLLSRRTVRALSDGRPVGSTTSLDKLAMSTAEKFLFDSALAALGENIVYEDSGEAAAWRNDYLYSRASSIYGGAAEIQRNIIAERLLGMPR